MVTRRFLSSGLLASQLSRNEHPQVPIFTSKKKKLTCSPHFPSWHVSRAKDTQLGKLNHPNRQHSFVTSLASKGGIHTSGRPGKTMQASHLVCSGSPELKIELFYIFHTSQEEKL